MKVSGNIVDVLSRKIFPGTLEVQDGKILRISHHKGSHDCFIIPGFVDAHIHVESSMLVPSEFARIAVTHGTVATVSDPHEIANVLGSDGVRFMVKNGLQTPFKFFFGVPSCVPASPFETSGATIGPAAVEELILHDGMTFLGEVMNVPGVLTGDPGTMKKIEIARRLGNRVDGHAPGLRGDNLLNYVRAGMSTDHETGNREEGREKLSLGMKLIIREGSAARNMDGLAPLIREYPDLCMFCSDDKHPHDLVAGHMNDMVTKAIRSGIDALTALRCACLNPVQHYGLPVGLLQEGDPADFLVVDNLEDFKVVETYIDGTVVAQGGTSLLPHISVETINNFSARTKSVSDFIVRADGDGMRVIEAIDGELITGHSIVSPKIDNGSVISDTSEDILKIAVVNRYTDIPPAVGFIRRIGIKRGAIASSVAHDSHNIIAVGVDDASLCRAVNMIVEHRGGIALVDSSNEAILPLPVAGIMSNDDGWSVARRYAEMDRLAKNLGSPLHSPFMTLSFMALSVIPRLKLTDRGLFDGEQFAFVNLFV